MNTQMRRAAVAVAATAMAVSLAACGSAKESGENASASGGAKKGDDLKIGLLLPENQTARYEKFDKPLIEKKISELTGGKAEVVYANAKQDATLQTQQVDMIQPEPIERFANLLLELRRVVQGLDLCLNDDLLSRKP